MIGTLLWKDLCRFRRNWVSVVILLALPLSITAIVGLTFGPAAQRGELPRIKLAVVDEDGDLLGSVLAGSVGNEQAAKYFDPTFEKRDEAMRLLNDNRISALVVIPQGFTSAFWEGTATPALELIKNPAQRFLPAIVEELLQVVVESLNAVSHNLTSEFPAIVEIFEDEGAPDADKLARIVTRVANKFEQAEDYLFPPLISYETTKCKPMPTQRRRLQRIRLRAARDGGHVSVVHRRCRDPRPLSGKEIADADAVSYRPLSPVSLRGQSKGLYSLAVMLISAAILMIGGGTIFRYIGNIPGKSRYWSCRIASFASALSGLVSSLIMKQERASLLNNVLIMLMAFAGGNVVSADGMPEVFRNAVSRWLPNYWFNQAIIQLEFNATETSWVATSVGLVVLGGVLLWISSVRLTRRLAAGGQSWIGS